MSNDYENDYAADMEPVQARLNSAMNEMAHNLSQPLPSAFCPDHFENVILFGRCWKHNPDGSLKPLFAKQTKS